MSLCWGRRAAAGAMLQLKLPCTAAGHGALAEGAIAKAFQLTLSAKVRTRRSGPINALLSVGRVTNCSAPLVQVPLTVDLV